jgi:glycerate dehydrogenase
MLRAAFLDFATLGPCIDTRALDGLVDVAYYSQSSATDMAERLAGRQIAIVNKARITNEMIDGAEALRLIVLAATGTDNVDVAAAAERGVAVANIRDYCTPSVVQHVLALMLSLTQHLAAYYELVRAGAWQRSESFALFDYPIRELSGRSLGVVGYGTLGRAVAGAAAALGMEVLVSARPSTKACPPGRVPFEAVLERADVLTLHCPLTASNRHLIGEAQLQRMKADALLINTARGALVDSAALARALREGQIAGAGIDVLASEPPTASEPLLAGDVPNLIVTPHLAWSARESRQRALDQVAENVEAFLEGHSLRRVV